MNRETASQPGMLIRLRPEGRTEEVVRRMMEAIDLGLYYEGQQLPSESELSAQFGVATVTLREALSELRHRGVIVTRRGRNGGSFICESAGLSDEKIYDQIRQFSKLELRDLCDEHMAISGAAARLAAKRASSENIEALKKYISDLAEAGSRKARRQADARFHIEVAVASQSIRLTSSEIKLQAELGELNWIAPDGQDLITGVEREHSHILDAITAGDANLAGALAEAHVNREIKRIMAIKLEIMAVNNKEVVEVV